jgi:hypothetical protein
MRSTRKGESMSVHEVRNARMFQLEFDEPEDITAFAIVTSVRSGEELREALKRFPSEMVQRVADMLDSLANFCWEHARGFQNIPPEKFRADLRTTIKEMLAEIEENVPN